MYEGKTNTFPLESHLSLNERDVTTIHLPCMHIPRNAKWKAPSILIEARGMTKSNHHTTDDFVVLVSSSSHRRLWYFGIACVVCMVAWGLFLQADRITDQLDMIWTWTSMPTFADVEEKSVDGIPSCAWSPNMENPDCFPLLISHMQASLIDSRNRFRWSRDRPTRGDNAAERRRYLNRRWLFLGDSTIYRLFLDSQLGSYLLRDTVNRYKRQRGPCYSNHFLRCSIVYCQRCDTMLQLSLTEASSDWVLPDYARGEGPMKFGYFNPYCTDCDGCNTNLLTCSLWKGDDAPCLDEGAKSVEDTTSSFYTGPAYGGYMSVEFARDVELQTDQYKTTQENLLSLYIAERWNSPIQMVEEFGQPICVVSTGHHDIALPNITKEIYLENVQWYLETVSQQCDYILWVSNNCPKTDDYAQTKDSTFEWNMAVQDLLLANPEYRRKSFVLDVFNASIDYPHADNIHMAIDWYATLATFVRRVMDADLGLYESH